MANQWTPKREVLRVVGPSIAYLALTRGQFALIDAEDAQAVEGTNWTADLHWGSFYATRRDPMDLTKKQSLHRFLMSAPHGVWVDHRDGNTLDNRVRCGQLRFAEVSQNMKNKKKPCTNTSGYKGVTWNVRLRRWHSRIQVDGRRISLGLFHDIELANSAYLAASQMHFGRFSREHGPSGTSEQLEARKARRA